MAEVPVYAASGGRSLDAKGVVDVSAPTSIDVTIALAGSLSGIARVDGRICGVIILGTWSAAPLTFQGSLDGTTFFDVYDGATERSVASAAVVANRFLALPLSDWLAIKFVKVRSGLGGAAVAQGGARVLTLALAG